MAGLAQTPPFQRTIIVNSGGSPTANGTALLAALSGITTNSSSNPWLLKLEPGTHDIGSSTVTMKDYVDVEGSGRDATLITSAQPMNGSSALGAVTVPSGVHCELRGLTVKNTFSTDQAIGVSISSSGFSLNQVNVVLPAGVSNSFGIYIAYVAPTLTQIGIQMSSSGGTSQGVYSAFASPVIKDLTVTIQDTSGVSFSAGFDLVGGNATLDGITATVSGAAANYGMYIYANASPLVTRSRFTVTAANNINSGAEGIRCYGSNCTLEDLRISADGGGGGGLT